VPRFPTNYVNLVKSQVYGRIFWGYPKTDFYLCDVLVSPSTRAFYRVSIMPRVARGEDNPTSL
jgi:hypothetical protein